MFDPILFWNLVALEANRVNHTNGQDKEQTGPIVAYSYEGRAGSWVGCPIRKIVLD